MDFSFILNNLFEYIIPYFEDWNDVIKLLILNKQFYCITNYLFKYSPIYCKNKLIYRNNINTDFLQKYRFRTIITQHYEYCKYFNTHKLNNFAFLRVLEMQYDYMITDDQLKNMRQLIILKLPHNKIITDEGIQFLTNLITLNLMSNENITDKGLQDLKKLKTLNLHFNKNITLNGILHLKKLILLDLHFNTNYFDDNNILEIMPKLWMMRYNCKFIVFPYNLCNISTNCII